MASAKRVDESLWWDSFAQLFEELDAAPLSDDLSPSLLEKVKANRGWFLDSVARFKPPCEASKLALDSPKIAVGSHHLELKPELKQAALRASACLCLDEVQSYILVNWCSELTKPDITIEGQELLNVILLQYYVERQCLLKCIRRIFLHALYTANRPHLGTAVCGEALQLVHDGLERKLLSTLKDLFSSTSFEKMEIDFTILWVEETLIEDNLVLDILFLLYYENFCSCGIEQWKTLCSVFKWLLSGSLNGGKLAVSVNARNSFNHSKAQLLLILIETLDLENLLRMVHDEVPFRQGCSSLTLSDIQEIDAVVSSFSVLGEEAGPVVLAWAIFLCLLLCLPESRENNFLIEIDHIGYVRQAFEAAPFNYILKFLRSDTLRESDGPVSGFLSILRTFISAFIASYELTHQPKDSTLDLIVDILCEIYHGEESLSMQFWDRESFIDGPIRSLVYMLEGEFPFHTNELVRLLSSLCEGRWSAECVYNFLDKMIGISTSFEIPNYSYGASTNYIVETHHELPILGVEGLNIPAGTRGYILKMLNSNTALVRWECMRPGITLLLLRLAREFHSNNYEELYLILNLLYRMVSFNTALCFTLMYINASSPIQDVQASRQLASNLRVDVVKIVCTLLVNLIQEAGNAYLVSICINILGVMLKCAPSHVVEVALRANIFGTENNGLSSGAWLLSGGLARMLLAEIEEDGGLFPLTTSVLDFTIQLVESGAENSMVSALVAFSMQYVFVNHVNWKCKFKHARWKLTLKVLEVMKSCIEAIPFLHNLGGMISDILVKDSSVHNMLSRLLCVSAQSLERLYSNHQYELKEIEGLKLSVCSALDVIYAILANLSEETFSSSPAFVETMLSCTTKRNPVVAVVASLISSRDSGLQVAAARVLFMLCFMASRTQPYAFENVSFVVNAIQMEELRTTIYGILDEELSRNEGLFIVIVNLLISAAKYQPSFLVSIILPEDQVNVPSYTAGDMRTEVVASATGPISSKKASPLDSILKHVGRSEILIISSPCSLLSILNLLKALWEGSVQYISILERIRSSEMFWKHLSSILENEAINGLPINNLEKEEAHCKPYRHKCHAAVLEIMAHEMFLQEKLLHDDVPDKQTSDTSTGQVEVQSNNEKSKRANALKDFLSTWSERPTVEKLIKLYSSSGYDKEIVLRAKMAVCLCIVHLIAIVCSGNTRSLSISLVERIFSVYCKLMKHPAFSALTAQYSLRGYSEGKELTRLVLNDLYYHMQGELEGREMASGPFKELSHFLLDLENFQSNESKQERDILPPDRNVCMYDITHLQAEFRMELWDHSDLEASKEVAEKMFLCMHEANLIMSFAESKYFTLKALIGIISLYEGNITGKMQTSISREIPYTLIESSIRNVSKCLQATEDILIPSLNTCRHVLCFLAAQAELLLILSRILSKQYPERTNRRQFLPLSVLLIKTSSLGIRFLAHVRSSSNVLDGAIKVLLMLFLTSVDFSYPNTFLKHQSNIDADLSTEASFTCLELLPVICKYTENNQFCNLSVASMDLILKGFVAPSTWLPILQKHLQLQFLVKKIHQNDALVSMPVILNFFLTLACIKGGAQLLHRANIFPSLKILFNYIWKDEDLLNNFNGTSSASISDSNEHVWGLGLAIITSMIYSLGGDSSCDDIVDGAICYYFCEKAYMTFGFLSALHFPADDHCKKIAQPMKTQTSLTALRNTELTLTLVCVLAKYQASWSKGMKEMDTKLRETSIHLLAFISKGVQRTGDPLGRSIPLACLPTLKEEVHFDGRPSFVNSKHGWFAISAVGSLDKNKASALSRELPLVIRDQADVSIDRGDQTYFSNIVAIQIYRIAFLLLKFLCMQARAAAKRAEEVEFIDLAHFPELPMPEILHGLQDQVIAIASEVCEANRSEFACPETENLCLLLLQVLERSLYLELGVLQSCGIRPVLGRVEDFSKEIKTLMKAVEKHPKLNAYLGSLKQIIALLYPGLSQTNTLI